MTRPKKISPAQKKIVTRPKKFHPPIGSEKNYLFGEEKITRPKKKSPAHWAGDCPPPPKAYIFYVSSFACKE